MVAGSRWQGTIVKRSAGRFSVQPPLTRQWLCSPRFLRTRIPRPGMRASRGARDARVAPGFERNESSTFYSPFARSFCLLPVSRSPLVLFASRAREGMVSIRLSCWTASRAHVYRESDAFARMLRARESRREGRKGPVVKRELSLPAH